jgi:acetyltransferase-like isoleucine patch superfamily enzyme
MASIKYLWSNRVKFPFGSYLFIKVWAKRILGLRRIYLRNKHRLRLISKGARVHDTSEIGDATIVGNKLNLSIGEFTFIGNAFISVRDKVSIGNRVCINDGVRIHSGSHDILDPKWSTISKSIVIEDYVWIATNAIILPGVRIGRGAVIGAGAVVCKSVAQGDIVVGNPAKPTSKKRPYNLTYNPCELLAENSAWLKG